MKFSVLDILSNEVNKVLPLSNLLTVNKELDILAL